MGGVAIAELSSEGRLMPASAFPIDGTIPFTEDIRRMHGSMHWPNLSTVQSDAEKAGGWGVDFDCRCRRRRFLVSDNFIIVVNYAATNSVTWPLLFEME